MPYVRAHVRNGRYVRAHHRRPRPCSYTYTSTYRPSAGTGGLGVGAVVFIAVLVVIALSNGWLSISTPTTPAGGQTHSPSPAAQHQTR